ncbi:NAD-dependent dehydratase [Bordetella genomosp. 1]|uniref:NAD-dependent dehydratase n=1 Tax=Bordetella genomosp. 1 TaxID=1395607 RepID=A0A261SGX0_9BORD|nr:NAD(P)-dependent oxidoreductase [Bordetella genomosp. 1]OZI36626.1 NAD-dependent dehydratase [Bordetella genomosp. 1]
MTSPLLPAHVAVTGAAGQIGRKVVDILARQPWCRHITALDQRAHAADFGPALRGRLTVVTADLQRADPAWTCRFDGVDAVVHLANRHSTPDASWQDALGSYDMTLNVLTAAATHGAQRLFFASSNHAMGGYKDPPLSGLMGPGRLTPDLEPAPGTRWFDGERNADSLAYGTAKVLGERLCRAYSAITQGRLATVIARIGWILPGDNDPRAITYSGVAFPQAPAPGQFDEPARQALAWFRSMWLSNADLERLLLAALTADAAPWPGATVTVNGVSANRGSVWDVQAGRDRLGYDPHDDVQRHLC